jgi:hypothetical protein
MLLKLRDFHDQVVVEREGVVAGHPDAHHLAHAAARPVRTDQIIGVDGRLRAGRKLADRCLDRARGLGEVFERRACDHAHAGQLRDPLVQDLLDRILRHPLRRLGKTRVAALGALERVFDHGERAPEQRGRKHDVGRVVGWQRRCGAQRIGHSPAPQVLHGAHVGGLGARLRPGAQALFDQRDGHPAQAEFDGEREADRAGADHQHLGVDRFGVGLRWFGQISHQLRHARACSQVCAGCVNLPARASTSLRPCSAMKTWMAGTSPAMTPNM